MALPLDLTVLIAEDSESAMELMERFAGELGYKSILKATDGQQALQHINQDKAHQIGLILADWNMPALSGIELLKAVRAMPEHKKTPFIMITADSEMDMIVQAISSGVSSYIVKPVTLDSLRSKLVSVFAALSAAPHSK